jgi:hypothetical protein
MRIAAIHRHPVKGFSPERLTRVTLSAGAHFPGDRMFAVENGPSGFDPADPRHLPKLSYLMLMRNEAIARLVTRYDDASGVLSIMHEGREAVRGDLATAEGRAAIEVFLTSYMPPAELRGPLKLLAAPAGYRFMDSRSGFLSLINLASLAALEERLGAPVDPLRFRGNLLLEGMKPWAEFDLVDQVLEGPSGVRLRITKRIDRCAATAVDPQTGMRDLPVIKTLMAAYGHVDCGVYAEIVADGVVAEGHRLEAIQDKPAARLGF